MAIKTRFIMPIEAFGAMRALGYTGTVDAMFTQFCAAYGYTDSTLRHKASAEGTTITEAVRRVVINHHPEMQFAWPPKQLKPKAHQQVKPQPSEDRQAVTAACRILAALLFNPDDGRTIRRARDYLAKYRD